jgi:hypothetical protein
VAVAGLTRSEKATLRGSVREKETGNARGITTHSVTDLVRGTGSSMVIVTHSGFDSVKAMG